jgi:hypothetical protein
MKLSKYDSFIQMKALTEKVITESGHSVFSRNELDLWIKGTASRRDALLRRAMAAGEISRIRRGMYMLSPPYRKERPNPLVLAQQVYGPSYISLESALSFHGWIPEGVYTVSSVSLNRSCVFETLVGRFEFKRVPQRCLYAGVDRLEWSSRKEVVLMASPLKALADYVYVQRLAAAPVELFGSLRIEEDHLAEVSASSVDELIANYPSLRVQRFLKAIRMEVEK